MRGYFGIGIEYVKFRQNIGSLFRSAMRFEADFIFTVGSRIDEKQAVKDMYGDTCKSDRHIPYLNFHVEQLKLSIPKGAKLVGVEIADNAVNIFDYKHPERAVYILGSEDVGLSKGIMNVCDELIFIPTQNMLSLNVAVAGSIVMYDRVLKNSKEYKNGKQ